ncbi:MAG: AraC family transcriptional regulator [Paracoccus sp. (in: a-proteobacteria)]|uniref:helix-turn-helix transcriptional regulator n=1 Tax=Paracoccus sp. TaxID=267 RepID=UPI0039E61D4A
MSELLRLLPLDRLLPDADLVRTRLREAGINAATILEPGAPDPRDHPEPAPSVAARGPAFTAPMGLRTAAAPGDGMRLIPLAGFCWGGPVRGRVLGRGSAATPRVRGDHVLIHIGAGAAMEVELPRMSHPLPPGRLAFIPAGTAFALHPPAKAQGWALLIPPRLAERLHVALPAAFRCGLPDPADRPLLEPTLQALGLGTPRDETEKTATGCHLGLLAVALSRIAERAEVHEDMDHPEPEARPLCQGFITAMTRDPAQDRTMSEIAESLGATLAQLDRACRQFRGKPALDLLYEIRRDHAALLLRETDMPIAQIAAKLGYSSLGHFMRAFAAATGRTPESLRQPPADDAAMADLA